MRKYENLRDIYRVRSKSFPDSYADYEAVDALDAAFQHMDELSLPNKDAYKFEVALNNKPFLTDWESVDNLIARRKE